MVKEQETRIKDYLEGKPALIKIFIFVINAIKYIEKKYQLTLKINKLEIMALLTIGYGPEINQIKVASVLDLDKTTASRLFEKLEKQGLILRTKNPENKRSKMLSLTENGWNLIHKGEIYWREYLDLIETEIDNETMVQFRNIFHDIVLKSLFLSIEESWVWNYD